jgi:MFS transporter, DHA1 family, tetracycline resistance protein
VKGGRTPAGFWTVWTSVAVDLLGFGIILPLLPLYAESFEATPLTIGLLFASYSLAQFVFSPVWGRVSDRVGRRPVLLVTIAGSAVGSLVLGLAGSVAMLFVGRIVDGVSGASVAVARATVADVAPAHERPRLMGLLGAAYGLGFVIGPSIGALAALFGPAAPFFVAAAISVANLVAAAIRLPETRRPGVPATPERLGTAGMPPAVLRLVLLTFVGVAAFGAFEATFALLGRARFDLTDSMVALVFSALGMVLVATQAGLVGPATRRLGETGVIRLGLAGTAVGFLLIGLGSRWLTVAPGLAVVAAGQGLAMPAISSAVAGAAPRERSGAALGIQQSAGGLARVVGPIVGGALFAVATGLPYLAAAALAIVGLLLVPTAARVPGSTAGGPA